MSSARPRRWPVTAVALCAAALLPRPAGAQPLAVPFLPQTEALCGGAAAEMVMRYWGASDTYPDAFAPLVDRAAGGIRTSALAGDLERRGWVVAAGSGDAAEMTKELGRRRPVIALIEDRPGRYHYVVVLDRTDRRVVLHDPAIAPSREVDGARFDAAWEKSGRWMLILLPPPAADARANDNPESASTNGGECGRLVDAGVARAAEDRAAARDMLLRATTMCAGESAAWRELAGLDALEQDWGAAAAHARRAVAVAPRDTHAWRILATASYMRHDDLAALDAWNQLGEPIVSLIDVKGLERMRYGVVADAIGVELKAVLSADAVRLAERRVRDLPAVAAARVTFHPTENGHAQIDAAVVERPRAPTGYASWIRAGFDAAADRTISAAFSNLSGGGDVAGASWRWWAHRPMVSAFYAAPAPRAIGGGVWRVDAMHETQTFGAAMLEETRTRAGLTLGRWLNDRTRVTGAVAIDRWSTRPRDVALGGALERRAAGDRIRLQGEAAHAVGAEPFTTAAVTAGARTNSAPAGMVLFAIAGYSVATRSSPMSLWPGADTGHARDVLLRAHPLLDDGVVSGGVFGRRLAFGTVEAQRWTLLHRLPVRIAPAAFVDVARAARGLEPRTDSALRVDAGAGFRLAVPGAGVMRIDLAHGLRGGGTVLSAAWDRRWH
jgi:Peptidase_C39 like family